jgi:DNA polymerase-4
VHSGQPLRTAARRCPDAVFLPVDRERYEATSARVMATVAAAGRELDAAVEVIGWDEAFLAVDVDDPQTTAHEIQERVRSATGLACTVGIGQNKLQAKVATGFGKPAGVFRLTDATWAQALGHRATDALWGIGPKTARRLVELGIRTVGDLAGADPDVLAAHLGPRIGPWLIRLARGEDPSPVVGTPRVARSRGREVTFQRNVDDWDEVRRELVRLSRQLADALAEERRSAVRIVVTVRYAPFATHTRGQALETPSVDPTVIERAAVAALDRFPARRPVRLLGVRAELAR